MKLKNKNIFCSVSAGYSSIMMAIKLREWYPDHKIIYGMANTSKEREESLDFMNQCDNLYDLRLNWIEAVINPEKRKGTGFNIVEYGDLKRKGEIFEDGIKKFGIPSKINKWCNRDLKLIPLKKFADNVFGSKNYSIAVGIRADEIDRIGNSYKENNIFYPLLDNGILTHDRNKFWNKQPLQIEIPAYKGNCDLCFEKSHRKLMTVLLEEPNLAKWWRLMTYKYSKMIIDTKPSYNAYSENDGMNFYRENLSIDDLIEMAKKPFRKATDEYIFESNLFDYEDDCGSGCQVF